MLIESSRNKRIFFLHSDFYLWKLVRSGHGNFDVFGIKIINILETQEFNINIDVSKIIKGNEEITDPSELNKVTIKYRQNVNIEKNDEENVGIGVGVAKDAVSGTYILDIGIPQYDELQKIYVEVP